MPIPLSRLDPRSAHRSISRNRPVLVTIDMLFRVDHKIDKQIEAAAELTRMGWEFASLSGDFEDYPSHQDAFEGFAHETELILGRLPSMVLPDDRIIEPKEEVKDKGKKDKEG